MEHPQQYTCPMHPEVIQEKPGNCPKCGMNLVPVKAAADTTASTQQDAISNPLVSDAGHKHGEMVGVYLNKDAQSF